MISFKQFLQEETTNKPSVVVECNELSEKDVDVLSEEHVEELAAMDEGWREFLDKTKRKIGNKISDTAGSIRDKFRNAAEKTKQVISSDDNRLAKSFAKTRLANFLNSSLSLGSSKLRTTKIAGNKIDEIKFGALDKVIKDIEFGTVDIKPNRAADFNLDTKSNCRVYMNNGGSNLIGADLYFTFKIMPAGLRNKFKVVFTCVPTKFFSDAGLPDGDDIIKSIKNSRINETRFLNALAGSAVFNISGEALYDSLVKKLDGASKPRENLFVVNMSKAITDMLTKMVNKIQNIHPLRDSIAAYVEHHLNANIKKTHEKSNFRGARNQQNPSSKVAVDKKTAQQIAARIKARKLAARNKYLGGMQ